MRLQKTISREVGFQGIGLHSGAIARIRLFPAEMDSGVVFFRSDRGVFINANISSVADTSFATTLHSNGTRIKTVEHLLAALAGLGIDNILIDIDGPEVPILDGSSRGLIEIIRSAGETRLPSPRPHLKITKPVHFREGNIEITALPHDGTMITYEIFYRHPLIGSRRLTVELGEQAFVNNIAPARTFGFLKDVEIMRDNGLAKGGSLENALILDDEGVVNPEGMRFTDEVVRHKILDLVGDLSLSGFPIFGHIIANRSGHSTNVKFVKMLLKSQDCWQIVTEEEYTRTAAAC